MSTVWGKPLEHSETVSVLNKKENLSTVQILQYLTKDNPLHFHYGLSGFLYGNSSYNRVLLWSCQVQFSAAVADSVVVGLQWLPIMFVVSVCLM